MSINKNKLKRLSLLAEAHILAMEEVLLLDKKYEKDFIEDFAEESAWASEFIDQTSNEKSINPFERESTDAKEHDGPVKSLHRALARATHPDITGQEENFKKIQKAYEEGDVSTLLVEAKNLCPDIEFTLDHLNRLEKTLMEQMQEVETIKQTLRWAWATSDKSDSVRVQVHNSLGINSKEFFKWKKSKTT